MGFYPNVKKPFPNVPADAKAMRTVRLSRTGKRHGGGKSGRLDPGGLEEWEGVTTFRDDRSPTGWIDYAGHVIKSVDTHGVVLLPDKLTGKLSYYDGHVSSGGFSFANALGVFGGDIFGLGLELAGQEDLNELRVNAGIAATAAIVGGGGLGASDASGLLGSGTASIGGEGTGGSNMVNLSGILSTDGTDGLPSWLGGLGGAIQEGIDIYGDIRDVLDGDDGASGSPGGGAGGGYQPQVPSSTSGASWLVPALLVGGLVLVLVLTRRK